MAFIQQPDVFPAMAEAIHRQLSAARSARLKRDALAAQIIPTGMASGPGNETIFDATVRELCGVGALREDGEFLMLPEDFPDARKPGAMRRIVCDKAMAAEHESDLWEKDEVGSLVQTGALDLVRALAWFLNLDVEDGPFDFDKTAVSITELQERQIGERPIHNVERWRPFVRWARYLGFIADMSLYSGAGTSLAVVVPDPTDAVRAVLPEFLDGDESTPIKDALLPALATRLPVLDGGVYRQAVLEKGGTRYETDCSPSMTLAFQRLSGTGVIELEAGGGDAPKATFANNQGAYHAVRLVGNAND